MTPGDALDPRAARLLHMLRAGEGDRTPGALGAEDRRHSLLALAALAADPAPADVAVDLLACPAADGAALALRRYTPPSWEAGAALLYVHGGGWVAGDLETHDGVCAALAAASRAAVFALDYRRPPEHPFPGPTEDALAALAWLRDRATALGIDPARLGVAGDSAGANLVAACLLDPRAGEAALQLLICPILDLTRTSGSRTAFADGYFISSERLAADAHDYLGGLDPGDPRASPLRAADLSGLPRTQIHAAAFDPFRDEALAYAERLCAAGVKAEATVHPGMIHYFYALARAIPAARPAVAAIGEAAGAALRGAR